MVQLNIGNTFGSVPIGHSLEIKENFKDMKDLFAALRYQEHQWLICGDLKVSNFILQELYYINI